MMVERKLDGAMDKSSADLHTTCEKSGGLHPAEPDLTAGWEAGWLTKFGQGLKF